VSKKNCSHCPAWLTPIYLDFYDRRSRPPIWMAGTLPVIYDG
jgi:hypothetical protein